MYVYRINYFECVSQVILSKSNYFNDFTNQIKEGKTVKSIEFIGQIDEEKAANQFGIKYSNPIGYNYTWLIYIPNRTNKLAIPNMWYIPKVKQHIILDNERPFESLAQIQSVKYTFENKEIDVYVSLLTNKY